MNESLMSAAYTVARQQYKAATQAVFLALDSQFAGAGFDAVHHAGERAMQLHLTALGFARRVWAGSLAYEKAEEMLRAQFSDFPASVCLAAFTDAYTETR